MRRRREMQCTRLTISMVYIYVDVKHPSVHFQQFQDCQDDIVDVAKSGCFSFFGMMQSSTPVDTNVRLLLIQLNCSIKTCSSVQLRELEETIENRAICGIARVVLLQHSGILPASSTSSDVDPHTVRSDHNSTNENGKGNYEMLTYRRLSGVIFERNCTYSSE